MKAITRVNSVTPFAVSAVRYLCTVHFDSCIRIALAAGLGLLASFAACADSVTTNKYIQVLHQAYGGDNDAGIGYTAALWKLNGEGEPVSPAKGENGCFNEYVAALGWGRWSLVRSLASGNNSFTGDGLTIGDDKDGTFLLRYGGNTLTVDHLTLVRGLITSGVGGETLASSNPIVVRSTTAGPFYFSIGKGRSITIDGPLYSEDDTALVVINRYSLEDMAENDDELRGGTINFNGENSAYKGKVKVDYLTVYGKGYTGTDSNTNIVLNVNSNNALGGTPAAAMPDALTLSNGGTLAVGYATSSEAPFAPGGGLRGLTVSNGGRVFSSSALYFAMPVTSSDGSTLRFYNSNLTLASSFSGSVSVDCTGVSSLAFANGFEWTSTGTLTLPNGTVVSKGEGYTKMVAQISEMAWSSDGSTIYTTGAHWSGGTGVSNDGTLHFLDYGLQCRTPEDNPLSFPVTEKLTIVNGTFTLKSANYTIGNLELCSGAKFDFANNWQSQSVSGGVTISSVNDFAVKFMTGGNHAVNASLTGNGTIVYGHRDNNTDNGSITVGGDNSGYIGSMRAEGNGITAKFSAANGLGGSPSTVLPQGLAVASGATVEFTGSAAISVNQPNRGMYIEASGTVKTAPDVTWKGPLAFSATDAFLSKTGSGTLALEGACGAGSITVSKAGCASSAIPPHAM